jgi:predicted membrane metal-binding protein
MKQYNTILQWFWLGVSILTAIYAILLAMNPNESFDPLTALFPVVAFILFLMRFWYNRKMKKAKTNE